MKRPINRIVGNQYDKLVRTMISCAQAGDMPQCLEIKQTAAIDLQDVKELLSWFREDTGLEMKMQCFLCQDCGELHAMLFVDYPDFEEDDTPVQ